MVNMMLKVGTMKRYLHIHKDEEVQSVEKHQTRQVLGGSDVQMVT